MNGDNGLPKKRRRNGVRRRRGRCCLSPLIGVCRNRDGTDSSGWLGLHRRWRRPGARCLSLTDPTGRPSPYHFGATRSIKVIGQARAALYPGPAVALAVVPEASNPPRLRDFPGFLRPLVFAFPASRPATEASCAGSKRERSCAVPSRRRERPLGAALMLTATNLNPKMIQARLGLATISETMDTYGHLFPDAEDLGRGAIDATTFAAAATEQAGTGTIPPRVREM